MPPIDAKTRLCALIGNPVEHSLSPAIHNAAFQHLGLNFAYVAFKVEDVEGAMRGIRALTGIRGVSVTIPHKIAVLRYLDEIDTTARNIGAVNTIVTDRATLTGYNTDASGALAALRKGGAPVEGGAQGRMPHHTRPGDVSTAGRRAVRAVDPTAGSGRGHAFGVGKTPPGIGASWRAGAGG